jgi:hypothetical protein
MSLVPPGAIVMLPPEINTIGLLRECMLLEQREAENPDHEVFIVVSRRVPDTPCAIVMRIRKDVAHIQGRWPLEVDRETRVAVIYPPNQVPIGDGRVG